MAKFKQGDKVRLKQDYYKHDWFRGLYRERRKAISEKVGKVARITTESMAEAYSSMRFPLGLVEIRFNDRSFLRVHEDMLESVATRVTDTEPTYAVANYCNDLLETISLITASEEFKRLERIYGRTSKHSYTAEQIAEAQRIIGELVVASRYGEDYEILDDENKKKCWVTVGCKTYTAYCSEDDEFNEYIGIMIAMCKANGRKVPDWVYGNE